MMGIITQIFNQQMVVLAMFSAFNGGVSQGDSGAYTPPATINYVETSLEQKGEDLIFGNLSVELPDGVTAEEKTSDIGDADGEKILVVKLNGAEKSVGDTDDYMGTGPFPPQIRLSHYRVDYECEEALISALLNLFPDSNLRVQYENRRNSVYIFRLGNLNYGYGSDYYHYALVCGEDLYMVGELDAESGYGFSALREQGKVKWRDSGRVVSNDTDCKAAYFKIMPEEGYSFLCHDDSELYFYLDGYYDHCYMSYESGKNGYIYGGDLEDVNFDGRIDIDTNGDGALVWDPTDKVFIEVEYLKICLLCIIENSFPKQKRSGDTITIIRLMRGAVMTKII